MNKCMFNILFHIKECVAKLQANTAYQGGEEGGSSRRWIRIFQNTAEICSKIFPSQISVVDQFYNNSITHLNPIPHYDNNYLVDVIAICSARAKMSTINATRSDVEVTRETHLSLGSYNS